MDENKIRAGATVEKVLRYCEKLVYTAGQAQLTPERVAEYIAGELLADIEGFEVEQFHICRG